MRKPCATVRAEWRTGGGASRVRVDPLGVAGDLGEPVDPLLGDLDPVADRNGLVWLHDQIAKIQGRQPYVNCPRTGGRPSRTSFSSSGAGFPVVAEPRPVLVHPRQDRRQADRVGVEHRAAAVAREAEAVAVDDVDVAGPRRVALLEDARAFVGQRRRDAREDLVVGQWRGGRCDASGRPPPRVHRSADRACPCGSRARTGTSPAGLLAVASHLEQAIGNRPTAVPPRAPCRSRRGTGGFARRRRCRRCPACRTARPAGRTRSAPSICWTLAPSSSSRCASRM